MIVSRSSHPNDFVSAAVEQERSPGCTHANSRCRHNGMHLSTASAPVVGISNTSRRNAGVQKSDCSIELM
jgi:hypothetical protein